MMILFGRLGETLFHRFLSDDQTDKPIQDMGPGPLPYGLCISLYIRDSDSFRSKLTAEHCLQKARMRQDAACINSKFSYKMHSKGLPSCNYSPTNLHRKNVLQYGYLILIDWACFEQKRAKVSRLRYHTSRTFSQTL